MVPFLSSSSPVQFRKLVNEYASALCTEKDSKHNLYCITCGNINDLIIALKKCDKTRFSLGELDTIIEFLCVYF